MARELSTICSALADEGLDLVQVFDAQAYNQVASSHAGLAPLPTFGRSSALALLIGNSRALWPRFIEAFAHSADLHASADPLDTHVMDTVRRILDAGELPYEARFSHEGGHRLVSMLHAAEASGLAHVGPAHLAVHEVHGPWFGLRALAVFDAAGPLAPGVPAATPCHGCEAPCHGCEAPCKPVFDLAMKGESSPGAEAWRSWLAIRDACPVGRDHRYGDDQIVYHYTKERAVLVRAAEREAPQ